MDRAMCSAEATAAANSAAGRGKKFPGLRLATLHIFYVLGFRTGKIYTNKSPRVKTRINVFTAISSPVDTFSAI